jgi:DNA (cytosine-5)-methyltransferase 1
MECANVDTTETITHVGLCAGYGGIELGLKRVLPALRSVALCEIEAFAIANLVAKMEAGLMDAAPVWTDLKTFPWESFRDRVDVLTGGYPCQPFSAAGKRAGKDDPRHLWPWIADGIAAMRPRVCFFENVEGHVSLGLSSVISDLEELGYAVSWGIFSASECGAPHQRKRVFILAYLRSEGLERHISWLFNESRREEPSRSTPGGRGSSGGGKLANTHSAGSWQDWESSKSRAVSVEQSSSTEGRGNTAEIPEGQAWPSRPGQPQHAWEPPRVIGQTQSPLGGDADGPSDRLDDAELYVTCDNRTDELRLLGNGVVPATAALAFTTLLNEQRNPRHLT